MDDIGILDAGIVALLGYAVVFVGLILLLIVVTAMSKVFQARDKKNATTAAAVPAAVPESPAPAPEAPKAPGSAGHIKLYNVEPKAAAMVMAIVANKLGKPINELRFISIKEVK